MSPHSPPPPPLPPNPDNGGGLTFFLLTTFIAVVISFILLFEPDESTQQEEESGDRQQRIAAAIAATTSASGRRTRETMEEGACREDDTRPKRRYIAYDRQRARDCILQDYLGQSPMFSDLDFQRSFRISRQVYKVLKEVIQQDEFFNRPEFDVTGRLNICTDAKVLIALKHLGYGCASNSWREYFQMGESTGRLCVENLCSAIAGNPTLRNNYLRFFTTADAHRVTALHEHVHGVPGMLGSLDCMHVRWKNCPIAYQGQYSGKEKVSTLVLEAVADHNLWFWHAAFGFAGSCNDINIFDTSPLQRSFIDGSHTKIDFEYSIDGTVFNKLFYLVDGIYPELSRFVKTISVPVNQVEKQFAGWQEAARKDVERAFGVLQSKWRLLASPIEKWDEIKIQDMVIACIIMHNMMVQERIEKGDGGYFSTDHDDSDDRVSQDPDEAELRVGEEEAERAHGDIHLQFQEDRLNLLSHAEKVIQERWSMLYDSTEHRRLQMAVMKMVTSK